MNIEKQRSLFLPLLTSAMALTLAGCNMAPRYERPALPVPEATPTGDAYGAGTATTNLAEMSWKDFFADARLQQVIATSLENNRDLRIALANIEQTRAQYRVQRADLLPSVSGSGSATYSKSPMVQFGTDGSLRTDVYSASVGISAWELDLFGRVRNLTEAAQQQFFAAQENRNAAQVALIAQVATTWLTLAADQDQLALARKTEAAYRQTLDLTIARFKAGVSSELDVKQANTSYDQARSDIAQLTTVIAQDKNALNLLAGSVIDDTLLPVTLSAQDVTLTRLPENMPSTIMLKRPDIAAAEHQLIAANANIGAARAAFFPKISLTAALGTISSSLSGLFGQGSENWSVAPSASLPIFDMGRNAANLQYSKATRDAMVAQYEKTVQTAFREAADALARRGTIGDQFNAQQSLRDNAEGAYRLSDARFKAGIEPFLTTLDSQRSLYGAEQSLLNTQLTRATNIVELYRALGGGLK